MVSTTTPSLEAWFIKSLASAGNCRKHNPRGFQLSTFLSSQRPDVSSKRKQVHSVSFRRQQSTQTAETELFEELREELREELPEEPNRTKEELMELVDQYSGGSYTDQLPLLEVPSLYQPSDGPNLTVSDKVEDEWPPPHYAWPADPETKLKLEALDDALQPPYAIDPEDVYQIYKELPRPRAPYLESRTRHRLLHVLSSVERRDEHSMLRYLSVIDDMKKAAIPLLTPEWNSAISFAARYVNRSTEVEVEAALHMWRQMEAEAGAKPDDATFNILFDVACKAGKFTLAEMIYKEMQNRGLKYDRYHHVSLIHYHGLRKNGDGARAAYQALVEEGEIVDTVVLNAMISALISSYEANAAENIYERMKRIHGTQTSITLNPHTRQGQRHISRVLKRVARETKTDPERRAKFQEKKSLIAPDLHTYRILVNYFAVQAGELNKVTRLFEEMQWFYIPIHGALFLALFKGFAVHGGIRYTQWTEARLESVWKSYMSAIDAGTKNLYISRWMVMWALRAFAKCSGKKRMCEVWEEVRPKWEPDQKERDFVLGHLRTLMEAEDMSDKKFDWLLGSL
ncbi:hypothetical protein G7Y89_g13542 [Cudoniella acicularis]|uniref:Pentatricopeptide repeat-containing protein n=1 Tax=Cudoniella acicularis TaxID=354080 RepID=A0A8H4VYK8_9HELO|nr:hypothetical protein G7Y89_g13542 [Cudoniella acicularis]